MTCNFCYHYEACKRIVEQFNDVLNISHANGCPNFKTKYKIIELPCEVGAVVYYLLVSEILKLKIIKIVIVGASEYEYQVENLANNHQFWIRGAVFGESLFATKADAENKLKGGNNNAG